MPNSTEIFPVVAFSPFKIMEASAIFTIKVFRDAALILEKNVSVGYTNDLEYYAKIPYDGYEPSPYDNYVKCNFLKCA